MRFLFAVIGTTVSIRVPNCDSFDLHDSTMTITSCGLRNDFKAVFHLNPKRNFPQHLSNKSLRAGDTNPTPAPRVHTECLTDALSREKLETVEWTRLIPVKFEPAPTMKNIDDGKTKFVCVPMAAGLVQSYEITVPTNHIKDASGKKSQLLPGEYCTYFVSLNQCIEKFIPRRAE
jgi:hypothetical protein